MGTNDTWEDRVVSTPSWSESPPMDSCPATARPTCSMSPKFPTKINIERIDIPSVKYLWKQSWRGISSTCKSAERQIGLIHGTLPHLRCTLRSPTLPFYPSWSIALHSGIPISNKTLPVLTVSRSLLAGWSHTTGPQTFLNSINWKPNVKLKVAYNISRIPQSVFTNHPSPSPHHKNSLSTFCYYIAHRHSFFIDVIHLWNSLPALAPPIIFLYLVCVLSHKSNHQTYFFYQQCNVSFNQCVCMYDVGGLHH